MRTPRPKLPEHWRCIVVVLDRVAAFTGRVAGHYTRARCRVIAIPGHNTKNCIAAQSLALCRVTRAAALVAALLRYVAGRCCAVGAAPYRDTKWSPPSMIQNLYRDSPPTARSPPRACCSPLRAGTPCRGPCWPCRVAVS